MKALVRISTGRIGRRSSSTEMVVDITVKSGDKAFAPTWAMVGGIKDGRLDKWEYSRRYRKMMAESYRSNPTRWHDLIAEADESGKLLVLVCYCKAGDFCHRHILKEILLDLVLECGMDGAILPERP